MSATKVVGPLWKRIGDYVKSLGDVVIDGKVTIDGAVAVNGTQAVNFVWTPPATGLNYKQIQLFAYDGTKNPAVHIRHNVDIAANVHYLEFTGMYSTAIGFADYVFNRGCVGINTNTPATKLDVNGDVTFRGIQVNAQTPQVLTGAGAVDITSHITHIVTTGADALTLADGAEGQEKIVIMKTDGGNATLTPTNLALGTSLTFSCVGDAVNLLFTNAAWHYVGGFNVVVT